MRSFLNLRQRQSVPLRAIPALEQLESRLAPYAVSGNAWPNPQLITISFIPDGTVVSTNNTGLVDSNLFSTFTTQFGSNVSTWENVILKAAQSWAQQTNINFTVVSDNGTTEGEGSYEQGDPNMGDIRIGGYNFGSNNLGMAGQPPPVNNFSSAGDLFFNTADWFTNTGKGWDLYTVAAHEIGHALGMEHSSISSAIMYGEYTTRKTGLSSDDISGIRDIYSSNSARSYDAYYGASQPNNSFANAADISSSIDPTALTATLTGLDMTTTSEVEYFKFTAPANTSGTLTVNVQSTGLSLLTPKMTVYAADQTTVLGTATGSGELGNTLSVTATGVTAGQQYYVQVQGADTTAFSTGAYALTVNLGSGPNPTVPLPDTTVANGYPLHAGGGTYESSGVDTYGVGNANANNGSAGSATPLPPATVLAPTVPFAAIDATFSLFGLVSNGPFAFPSASLPSTPQNTPDVGQFGFGGGSAALSFAATMKTSSSQTSEDAGAEESTLVTDAYLDWAEVPAVQEASLT